MSIKYIQTLLVSASAVIFSGCLSQDFEKQSLARYKSELDKASTTFVAFESPAETRKRIGTKAFHNRNSGGMRTEASPVSSPTNGFSFPAGGSSAGSFTFPRRGKFTFPDGGFTAPRGDFTWPEGGKMRRPANGFTWPNDPSEGPNQFTWPKDARGGFTQPDSGFTQPKGSGFSFPE